MVVVNIAQLGIGIADARKHNVWGNRVIRYIYYIVFALAWALSYRLVRFEFKRRLSMSWCGQRFFWPISFVIYLVTAFFLAASITYGLSDDDLIYAWCKLAILIICIVFTFILAIIAIKKPNDFYQLSNEYFLGDQKLMRLSDTDEWSRNLTRNEGIHVKIKDYSAKEGNLVFHISVQIIQQKYSVSRRWNEFEVLHRNMCDKFGSQNFPAFPAITQNMDIDRRMKLLEEYLNEIAIPKLLIDEQLEFLKVPSKERKQFQLAQSRYSTNMESFSQIGSMRQVPSESYDMGYYVPELSSRDSSTYDSENSLHLLQKYIHTSILTWNEVETYVEYTINITYKHLDYSISKRYRDFAAFHEQLSREIAPGKPPELPEKNPFMSIIKGHDPEFVTVRKNQLEAYISEVLNDPAYHTPLLFQFIAIDLNPKRLWREVSSQVRYVFVPPLTWEGDVDNQNKHYITYTFQMEKYVGAEVQERWSARRRYKEWSEFHSRLLQRDASTQVDEYLSFMNKSRDYEIPSLPRRSYRPLTTPAEIETRRAALEDFLMNVSTIPYIHEAYVFRQFVNENSVN